MSTGTTTSRIFTVLLVAIAVSGELPADAGYVKDGIKKTGEGMKQGWSATKDASKQSWEATKDETKKGVDSTKKFVKKVF